MTSPNLASEQPAPIIVPAGWVTVAIHCPACGVRLQVPAGLVKSVRNYPDIVRVEMPPDVDISHRCGEGR